MSGNPCDECLVKPACKSVCPDKENYGTFLQMGSRQLQEAYRHYKGKKVLIPKSILEQSRKHEEKLMAHLDEISKISKGDGERLYIDEHKIFLIPTVHPKLRRDW